VRLDALENYLISMARSVEISTSRVLGVLSERNAVEVQQSVGQIFMLEPRINEMEMLIDEQAVRLLRENRLADMEIRQVVATLKITNDLERMGDLAVGLAERVLSLAEMPAPCEPPELEPMVKAVGAMVTKSLGALTLVLQAARIRQSVSPSVAATRVRLVFIRNLMLHLRRKR